MGAAVAAQSMPGEAEITSKLVLRCFGRRSSRSKPLAYADATIALRASGRQVTWGKMGKGRWRQGTGAKDVEEGSAAVAEPFRP